MQDAYRDIIKKEYRSFLEDNIKNEQVEEDILMNTDTLDRICRSVEESVEEAFKKHTLAFLIKYGADHDLTFKQLQSMIGASQNV